VLASNPKIGLPFWSKVRAGRKTNLLGSNGLRKNCPVGVVPFCTLTTRNELEFTLKRSISSENWIEISRFWKVLTMEQKTCSPPIPFVHPKVQVRTKRSPPLPDPLELEQPARGKRERRPAASAGERKIRMITGGGCEVSKPGGPGG